MTSRSLLLTLLIALTGCAGLSSSVDTDMVRSWQQRADERGLLPVGTVLAVERVWFQRGSTLAGSPAYPSPQVAAAGAVLVPAFEAVRNADWVYRHQIVMKSGETRIVDLSYQFKAGECVAFRAGLQDTNPLPIPSLPGECS